MAIQANRQARETIDDRSTHYKPGQGMRNHLWVKESRRGNTLPTSSTFWR
jgi:hypothetical protein